MVMIAPPLLPHSPGPVYAHIYIHTLLLYKNTHSLAHALTHTTFTHTPTLHKHTLINALSHTEHSHTQHSHTHLCAGQSPPGIGQQGS